jgi:hypothetical protein
VTPAIEAYLLQLLTIRQDVPGLVANLSDEQFAWTPGPRQWSMAQCFEHLNTAARVGIPAIDHAIADARARGLSGPGPFVLTLFERLFLRATEPPPRMRVPSPRVLRPVLPPGKPKADVVADFLQWQDQIGERIRQADGLDLQRARARSPALPLFVWSLGGHLAITLAHERRHLWQARQVRNALSAAS